MLEVPGIKKKYYAHSKLEQFKSIDQLGLTSDEAYRKHAALILSEIVSYLDKYKNNPAISSEVAAKQAEAENRQAEIAMNRENNKRLFEAANKEISNLEEGEVVCLTDLSDFRSPVGATSNIVGYVEKYNSSKTKLQIRIHQISQYPVMNVYDNINFVKGDLIWINLPMTDIKKYWGRCK